jgi:predicted Zn-dependent protease with MMP-like domain
VTKKSFEALVRKAIDRIPSEFQAAMKNIAILIEDWPGPEAEDLMEEDAEGVLYGFYQGTPLPERTADDSGMLPDVIYLYRKPLEEDFPDPDDLIREIEVTLVHEIAHYFGFDEDILARYGYD